MVHFYGRVIFLCVPHLLYLCVDEHMYYLRVPAIVYSAAVKIGVGLPWWFSCKESTCQAGNEVHSLSQEYPLEKEMITYSSILAWEIPWAEGPGGYSPQDCKRVWHDLATKQQQQNLGIHESFQIRVFSRYMPRSGDTG